VKNKYLRHARLSEHEFRSILELFCADVEALKATRITGVNKNTTLCIYGLLRKRATGSPVLKLLMIVFALS